MQAIAEGDESAAAALSARLGNGPASASSISGHANSHHPRLGSNMFSSPGLASRNLVVSSSSIAPLAMVSLHDEVEEEPHLLGLEHETIPFPPQNANYDTDESEIEEEEDLK